MFVSPTEPAPLRRNRKVSLRTERWGVDYLWTANGEWWGVQRKAVPDLLASALDGRLTKELAQIRARASANALHPVLIVEGRVSWTTDGVMLAGSGHGQAWTRAQWLGLLWTIRASGLWVEWTNSVDDTDAVLTMLEAWTQKERHGSTERRPGPVVAWGTATNRDWQIHFLCGLPGVGPETAKAILDAHGMPFVWKVGERELLAVPGVGPKTVQAMSAAVPLSAEPWT